MHVLDSVAVNLTTKEYRLPESRRERALPAKSASTAKFHKPMARPSLPETAPPCGGLRGDFSGGGTGAWDRSQSIPSSPSNHGSAAKPERRTLADYGVTSGGRVRRPDGAARCWRRTARTSQTQKTLPSARSAASGREPHSALAM